MRAAEAKDMELLLYRAYVTDGLKALTDSVSGAFGGSALSRRWFDQLMDEKKPVEDAEQIKDRIKRKLEQ